MQKKSLLLIVFVILIASIFIYTHYLKNLTSHKNEPQRVTVTTQRVLQKDATAYIETIGTVAAYSTVNIKSLVDGQLLKAGFTGGQFVQQGQLLFSIDPRPFQIALQQAQANLAKDKAQWLNAQLTLQRYKKLIKQGYVAQQDYDTNRANADALAATVKADEATIANTQLQLSYTNITASINGRTGDILIQPGNLVKTAEGATLVTINQINPIYINFTIAQQYLPLVQQQQTFKPLLITAYLDKANKSEQGQLTFINNTIDTTTGTVQLKATFANADHLLWPGQFVKINLPTISLKNALIIPTQAIQEGQKGSYVFVIRTDNKAYYQAIKAGPVIKEGTIIEQGLKAGDKVAIDTQFLLTDGTPVTAIPAK